MDQNSSHKKFSKEGKWGRTIKIAACQLEPELGNIKKNLNRAQNLLNEGFENDAQWVILPEFFTSGMAYHPQMDHVALPLKGSALQLMLNTAQRYNGYVGGSFISAQGKDRYNTFVLAFPDGTYKYHNKDIPTMWENCYYKRGLDNGIIETREATVGLVICWEFLRWQTARRLLNKIDFVIGGSGCWTFPKMRLLEPLLKKQSIQTTNIWVNAFAEMAKILGVTVVHAGLVGKFKGSVPFLRGTSYYGKYYGETQIVDAHGKIKARLDLDDGEGIITHKLSIGKKDPLKSIESRFWIPQLPWSLKLFWQVFNWHGRRYYKSRLKKRMYVRDSNQKN